MKFNKNDVLKYTDPDGDRLVVRAFSDFFILSNSEEDFAVSMTFEEARKFAKAIRKRVKLAEMGDLG